MGPTASTPADHHLIAVARGWIAAALRSGADLPDAAALQVAAAWDALDDGRGLPPQVEEAPIHVPTAQMLANAAHALRQAIPEVVPAVRALDLAAAIGHLDSAIVEMATSNGG